MNEYLPTVHGFDEFFGVLVSPGCDGGPHAIAITRLLSKTRWGLCNMIHTWATDKDDPTEQPRWGKIGKQKIEDAGQTMSGQDEDRG